MVNTFSTEPRSNLIIRVWIEKSRFVFHFPRYISAGNKYSRGFILPARNSPQNRKALFARISLLSSARNLIGNRLIKAPSPPITHGPKKKRNKIRAHREITCPISIARFLYLPGDKSLGRTGRNDRTALRRDGCLRKKGDLKFNVGGWRKKKEVSQLRVIEKLTAFLFQRSAVVSFGAPIKHEL